MDTVAIAKVIFGPEGVEPILGVIALESAGVTVDPVAKTLRREVTRYLKKASNRRTGGLTGRPLNASP
jgi:hypothetical protein